MQGETGGPYWGENHFTNPRHDEMIARLSHWLWWVRIGRPDGATHPGYVAGLLRRTRPENPRQSDE